jgi:hypothetical protein
MSSGRKFDESEKITIITYIIINIRDLKRRRVNSLQERIVDLEFELASEDPFVLKIGSPENVNRSPFHSLVEGKFF